MTEHRVWFQSYEAGVPRTLEPYPDLSVFQMFERTAAAYPNLPATSFFGAHMTYAKLAREVRRFAGVLFGLGVTKGDRVALVLPNCPQYVITYYATVRLGAIVVGNNPLYTREEMRHQLKDAAPKVVVTLDRFYPVVADVAADAGSPRIVVTRVNDHMAFPLKQLAPIKLRGDAKKEGLPWPPLPRGTKVDRWADLMKRAPEPPEPAAVDVDADPAGFIYTGGTTGPAKGAMLSHRNIVANAMQSAAWFPALEMGKEGVLCVLPFFHSYGMTVGMNLGILLGAKLILAPQFHLQEVLKLVQKEKATLFPGVPRIYQAINESPESAKFDLSSIKACLSGAAALPKSVADKFEELTGGGNLREGFGLTECSPVALANPIGIPGRVGSIGMPIPDTDCRVVALEDPDSEVAHGEIGELLIRGPQVMMGYWNHPIESAATVVDGWLRTGDIARMDDEGFFFIVDRMKEMIIVSGFNVYPTEIEKVLSTNPKIAKVCVAGVPDERTGEAVKAFVVLKAGETATTEEMVAWSRERLSGYHCPKQFEFRDSLPETVIGKVLRRVLQQEEREKLAVQGPKS
jgi:long-chain acyl-CoA synthetase